MLVKDYSEKYREAATQLELLCIQGKKIKMSFYRKDYAARSRVYEKYYILCGFDEEKLIALGTGALKDVKIRGGYKKAGYIYDIRTHPSYRRMGIASKMITMLEDKLKEAEIYYCFVLSDNEASLNTFKKLGYVIGNHFNLLVIPTHKLRKTKITFEETSLREIEKEVGEEYSSLDLFCKPKNFEDSLGYVASYKISNKAFCSVWSNEKVMQERVMDVPLSLKIIARILKLASFFVAVPSIPEKGGIIRTWYIFNLYSENSELARELLFNLNNLAFKKHIDFLNIPIQPKNEYFKQFKRYSMTNLEFSVLQKNDSLSDDIYLDIRDL